MVGRHGSSSWRTATSSWSQHAAVRERAALSPLLPFFPFLPTRMVRMGCSFAVSFLFPVLWKCSHRHAQRCVSQVVAGILKLVLMKIDHHIRSHHTVQMASNSRSFSLNFSSARVMGIGYHTCRASSTSHSPCMLGIPLLSLYLVAQLPSLLSFVLFLYQFTVPRQSGEEKGAMNRAPCSGQKVVPSITALARVHS